MQIRPWPFVEMSKQPDTFIYGTIYLQSVIQKEYCLEIFHGPKVEVTQFLWFWLNWLCIRMQQATETEE